MSLTVRSAQDTDEDAVVALWRASDLVAGDKDPSVDFQFARSGASSDVLVGVDEAGQVKQASWWVTTGIGAGFITSQPTRTRVVGAWAAKSSRRRKNG